MYRRPFFSVATAYGQETEDVARQAYLKLMRLTKPALTVRKVGGLCVSVSQPWLAGSPDGAVQDPSEAEEGLLEIKCPSSAVGTTLFKCARKRTFCLRKENRKLQLKKSHAYFYQIQVQMFVACKPWCDVCVYTPSEFFVQRIRYDPNFICKILPKLQHFYCTFVLPRLCKH